MDFNFRTLSDTLEDTNNFICWLSAENDAYELSVFYMGDYVSDVASNGVACPENITFNIKAKKNYPSISFIGDRFCIMIPEAVIFADDTDDYLTTIQQNLRIARESHAALIQYLQGHWFLPKNSK